MLRDYSEDDVWERIHPNHLWVMDKLIVSRKMGYKAGPVGQDVPDPGWYIVRPCVNMMGMGLGSKKIWIEKDTTHLPLGHFWCEWFEGRHLSVDYHKGQIDLVAEGLRSGDDLTRWDEWRKVDDIIPFPRLLDDFIDSSWVNCEFIGDKLIEVHFRRNPDFRWGNSVFIPVWEEETRDPVLRLHLDGHKYIACPEYNGRVGAYIDVDLSE